MLFNLFIRWDSSGSRIIDIFVRIFLVLSILVASAVTLYAYFDIMSNTSMDPKWVIIIVGYIAYISAYLLSRVIYLATKILYSGINMVIGRISVVLAPVLICIFYIYRFEFMMKVTAKEALMGGWNSIQYIIDVGIILTLALSCAALMFAIVRWVARGS
jgi:hypothetical protein